MLGSPTAAAAAGARENRRASTSAVFDVVGGAPKPVWTCVVDAPRDGGRCVSEECAVGEVGDTKPVLGYANEDGALGVGAIIAG